MFVSQSMENLLIIIVDVNQNVIIAAECLVRKLVV